jgi:hypothetical protein
MNKQSEQNKTSAEQNAQSEQSWQEILYQKTFAEEYAGLERRRANAPATCAAADIEALLKTLYALDGGDWLGRGEVQSINLSATIAAHESFLSDMVV